jgi:hypothetical protein
MELQQLLLAVVEVDQVDKLVEAKLVELVELAVVEQDLPIMLEIILQEQLTLAVVEAAEVEKILDLLVKMVVQV